MRTKYQGVFNIIRFNWHFFAIAFVLAFLALYISIKWTGFLAFISIIVFFAITLSVFISLFTSWFIYDQAGLYNLNWLDIKNVDHLEIANINAGFDETTSILRQRFPNMNITSFDFFDEERHTEVSIKRARAAYPESHGRVIDALNVDLQAESFNVILLFMSLHEIRSDQERIHFLEQLSKSLKKDGEIIVVEHLRDWKNFLAYSIGFLHFFSLSNWKSNFENASLKIVKRESFTPFINIFKLRNS